MRERSATRPNAVWTHRRQNFQFLCPGYSRASGAVGFQVSFDKVAQRRARGERIRAEAFPGAVCCLAKRVAVYVLALSLGKKIGNLLVGRAGVSLSDFLNIV